MATRQMRRLMWGFAAALMVTSSACSADTEQPLYSNVFFDVDIREALSDVASQTGVIIIPDDSVAGYVTIELENQPLKRAMELLLMPGGYVYELVDEGIYLVTSPDPEAPNFSRIARTEIVDLDYISSEELQRLMPDIYARFVKYDLVGNRVVVTAPQLHLEQTMMQIEALDQMPLQVMIEALIVEASDADLDTFATSIQGGHLGSDSSTGLVTYVEQAAAILYQVMWLVEQNRATIKASPRLVAQEGREANLKISTEQYFQILSGRVGYEYVSLEAIEAAVSLTIVPHVALEDRKVTCMIHPEVGDVVGRGANSLPIITRRSVTTTVRVGDGEIIAIGGLLQEVERVIRRKIPILGDIPLIGKLFQSKEKVKDQRSVMILLVPHIMNEDGTYSGPLLFDRQITDTGDEALAPAPQ